MNLKFIHNAVEERVSHMFCVSVLLTTTYHVGRGHYKVCHKEYILEEFPMVLHVQSTILRKI
jgi:hypothetical protein